MRAEDWLARRASLSPENVALIDTLDGDREITFKEWNESANRTAHFFKDALNVRKGDRVAVIAKNSVAYLDIWFALNKLGAVLQNLNWRLTPYELADLVADAEPVCLVYSPEFEEVVTGLVEKLDTAAPALVCMCEKCVHEGHHLRGRTTKPGAPLPDPQITLDDPWVICYTGGTTGLPKGAVLTYRSITANAVNTIVSWGLSPDDVTILNAPLFHTGGLNVFTAPLVYLGGTSIVCAEFSVDQTIDLLSGGGVSIWFGVPTMFVMMQNHASWAKADFGSCRFLISGGAPCPMPVFEKFWALDVDFKTGYGLTEAGPNTFWLPAEQVREKRGAVGYPLFHVDIELRDDVGNPVGTNEVGELFIRGPHLFAGYWRDQQATNDAVQNGWLRTGDLAMRDDDGCYWIKGRIKDMIISGGENIYPSEIENVLHSHPLVSEAAVFGVPNEKWGEVGCAAVVLQEGGNITMDALRQFCEERLARYKIPLQFHIADHLPKTGANKIDKQALVKKYS